MKKKNIISEIFGWYGVVSIVSAYALSSLNVFSTDNLIYQLLNMSGALGIVYDSFRDKDYQPVVLNIIWAIIALIAIIKILS